MADDLTTFLRALKSQGYEVTQTKGSNHYQIAQGGTLVATSSGTPGPSALPRLKAEIRRHERRREQQPEPASAVLAAPPPSPPPPPPPAEPAPAAPPEPDELRELVTEARQVLADLRAARREIERLLEEDAPDLIKSEIVGQMTEIDIIELVKTVMDALHESNQALLDDYAQVFGKLTRSFDRRFDARLGDVDEVLAGLQTIRAVWERAASSGRSLAHAIPPAFVGNGGNGK